MPTMALNHDQTKMDVSYGIYTIERLPKGSKRTPRWDLHSMAKDRMTAEAHAKTLSAQPYFDHIEIQEFRVCPITKERTVQKIRSYSRKSSAIPYIMIATAIAVICLFVLA